ncbi:MAG: hypothetical protein OXG47_02350 [bacterium]|nr:hypothetical protein [bacterium]
MLNFKRLRLSLLAVALTATTLVAVGSSASAQVTGFTFANAEASNSDWEVKVFVDSFGGCGESTGHGDWESGWLDPKGNTAQILNLNCTYTITATARNESSQPGSICEAEVSWDGSNWADEVMTNDSARGGATAVQAQRKTNGACDASINVTFHIEPEDAIEALPRSSYDSALEARAERAVEASTFRIRVGPNSATRSGRGCNKVFVLTLQGGDDGTVKQAFPGIPSNGSCKFDVTIQNAPAPFRITDSGGLTFDTSSAGNDGAMTVELGKLVQLPYGRIAIVQNVRNSNNQGTASYEISRSCGGVASGTLPPAIGAPSSATIVRRPGGGFAAPLNEGRFTVHDEEHGLTLFGPGGMYLALARSLTSNNVEGCTVTATISDLPSNCGVAAGTTQTRTWRAGGADDFIFEFIVDCAAAVATTTTTQALPPPAPPPTTQASSGGTDLIPTSGEAEVRIVVRKRSSDDRVEFALQARGTGGGWSDRILPAARLLPRNARVDQWLGSSAMTVSDTQVRIIARLRASGRVEFALQERDGATWSNRLLPPARYLPAQPPEDRWLGSSVLTVGS